MMDGMTVQTKRARLSIVVSRQAEADAPEILAQLVLNKFGALGEIQGAPVEIRRAAPLADEQYPSDYVKVLYEAEIRPTV